MLSSRDGVFGIWGITLRIALIKKSQFPNGIALGKLGFEITLARKIVMKLEYYLRKNLFVYLSLIVGNVS